MELHLHQVLWGEGFLFGRDLFDVFLRVSIEVLVHGILKFLAEFILHKLVATAFNASHRHLLQTVLNFAVLIFHFVDLLLGSITALQEVDILFEQYLSQLVELAIQEETWGHPPHINTFQVP